MLVTLSQFFLVIIGKSIRYFIPKEICYFQILTNYVYLLLTTWQI